MFPLHLTFCTKQFRIKFIKTDFEPVVIVEGGTVS